MDIVVVVVAVLFIYYLIAFVRLNTSKCLVRLCLLLPGL